MAQIPYRANLQSMTFPLLSELSGRTIINPQQDQTFARYVSSDGQAPIDTGVPQIFYCHNVMPATYGWQSVRYNTVFTPSPTTPGDSNFQNCFLIYGAQILAGDIVSSTGYKSYLAITGTGTNRVQIVNPTTGQWALVNNAPIIPAGCVMTVATINGVSYIYLSGVGCYIYLSAFNALSERILNGLNKGTTLGIVPANGYLNAWTKTGVAWSSTVDIEDFVPSDVSGAGGGEVQEAKGEIVTAVATALGYILFTKENAVSVIFSGNAEFPWNFKGIPASGGISSAEVVSRDQAAGYQQGYTTNGLQQISHVRCNTVAPDVTDFIAGNVFEDFDPLTNTFSSTTFNWTMRKKLAVVADRYIVLSYGVSPTADMTHALVFDLTQNRRGKLKITHTSCFEVRSLDSSVTEIPRDSLAFLQHDGTVKVVDFSLLETAADSVLIMGKYQYVRQRMIELNQLEIENVEVGDDFSSWAMPSLNGKNLGPAVPGYLLETQDNYRKYVWDGAIGVNVSWLFKGTFNINSLVGWFSLVGNP